VHADPRGEGVGSGGAAIFVQHVNYSHQGVAVELRDCGVASTPIFCIQAFHYTSCIITHEFFVTTGLLQYLMMLHAVCSAYARDRTGFSYTYM
jgi:hypothetical protein